MIPGIKVWQEPFGGWTAACYMTPECIENDWHGDWYHAKQVIREWLEINAPTAHFDIRSGLAEFGCGEQAEQNAILFKLRFQGEQEKTAPMA